MDEISVHDNFVVSYSVDAQAREILIHTIFRDKKPNELTTIRFSDVAAYYFVGDDFKTILFDVAESTVEDVVKSNRSLFLENKNYCWPMMYESEAELLEKMSNEQMRAFLIESACGMAGWVWAKEMSKTMELVEESPFTGQSNPTTM